MVLRVVDETNPVDAVPEQGLVESIKNREAAEARDNFNALLGFIPGSIIGGADTLLQSTTFGLVDDNTFQNSINSISESAGQVYQKNKNLYRGAGEVATLFAGVGLASKALRVTGAGMQALSRAGNGGKAAARIISTNNDRVEALNRLYRMRASTLTGEGVINSGRFASQQKIRKEAFKLSHSNQIKEAVAGELVLAGTLNQSELFFPEGQSNSDIAIMAAAGGAFGVGVGAIVTNARLARSAALAGENLPKSLSNFTGEDSLDLISGVQEIEIARAGPQSDLVRNDPKIRGAFQQRGVGGEAQAKRAVEKLVAKSPFKGITSDATELFNTQKITEQLKDGVITRPQMTANIVSVERPGFANHFDAVQEPNVIKRKDELVKLEDEIKQTATSGAKDTMMFKADELRNEIKLLEKDTFAIDVNRLNLISTAGEETDTLFNKEVSVQKFKSQLENPTSEVYKAFNKTDKQRSNFGIADNGKIMFGNRVMNKSDKLDLKNISEIYSAIPKAVDGFIKKLDDPKALFGKPTVINRNTPLETFDFLLNALSKTKNGVMTDVEKGFQLGKGVETIEDVRKLAFEKRFERFVSFKRDGNTSAQDLTIATNLRMSDEYGEHAPAYEFFEDIFADHGKDAIKNFKTYEDVLKAYRVHFASGSTTGTINDLMNFSPDRIDDLLNFDIVGKIESDLPAHSLLLRTNANQIDDLTQRALTDSAVAGRDVRMEKLNRDVNNTEIPNFLTPVNQYINNNRELVENVKQLLPKTDQNQVGSVVSQEAGQLSVFTKNHRTRFIPAGKDVSTISDGVARASRQHLKNVTNEIMQDVQVLRQRNNIGSLQLYNNYHSEMQRGWRLNSDVIPENGMFPLAKEGEAGKRNLEIAEAKYGKGEKPPEFLPDPLLEGKQPLVLNDIAANALRVMREVDRRVYNGNQMLSQAAGKGVGDYLNGHTIWPSNFGSEVVFIADETGGIVDHVSAPTAKQADALAAERVNARSNSKRFSIVNKNDIENYKVLMDQAFNSSTIDISDSFALTSGRQAEGGRTGIIQGVDFINAQMDEIENLVSRQANRYTAVEFQPELNQLQHMQNLANVNKTNRAGEQTVDDAYDLVISSLLNSNNRNEHSTYGKIDNAVETFMNGALDKMSDLYNNSSLARSFSVRNAQNIAKQMDREFGYHPMKRVEEQLLANKDISSKHRNDIRRITKQAGALTQNLALKLFETSHAILTTASVMTTVPHTLAMYKRIGNESNEARKQRIGFAAEFLDNDNFAHPNEIKLTTSTFFKYMKGGFTDVIDEATKLGYLEAPMGEFMSALGSRTRSKKGEWAQKVLKASGALSQGSENFARTMSFLTSYELLNRGGRQGRNISMSLANDMSNRVIADYRSHNRSELFKGVTGVPLGMFQSFAINYFEKMYETVENKNLRELAIRYGTQSFIFGGSSVAGFDFFNETALNNWDRTQNPENYIKQGTEKELSDVLLYGTLGNLPKLLNLVPGVDNVDGISLHTRGEIQTPKLVGIPRPSESPMVNFVGRSMGFLGDAVKNIKENGSLSDEAVQESLIHAVAINRPIKGLLEIAQGYATNSNHDIVNGDTREFSSIIARVIGSKPQREAFEAKALFNNRQTNLEIRDKNARLTKSLVARIRNNELTSEEVDKFINQYIANKGGNPRGLKRWLRNAYIKADLSTNKFEKEITKKLRSDPNGRQTQQLLQLDF